MYNRTRRAVFQHAISPTTPRNFQVLIFRNTPNCATRHAPTVGLKRYLTTSRAILFARRRAAHQRRIIATITGVRIFPYRACRSGVFPSGVVRLAAPTAASCTRTRTTSPATLTRISGRGYACIKETQKGTAASPLGEKYKTVKCVGRQQRRQLTIYNAE